MEYKGYTCHTCGQNTSLASTEVQKYIQENDLREYMNPCFFCAITMKQAHLLSIPHLDDIPQGVTKSLQNIYIENEDINFEKMPLDRSINRPQVRAKLFGQDQQGNWIGINEGGRAFSPVLLLPGNKFHKFLLCRREDSTTKHPFLNGTLSFNPDTGMSIPPKESMKWPGGETSFSAKSKIFYRIEFMVYEKDQGKLLSTFQTRPMWVVPTKQYGPMVGLETTKIWGEIGHANSTIRHIIPNIPNIVTNVDNNNYHGSAPVRSEQPIVISDSEEMTTDYHFQSEEVPKDNPVPSDGVIYLPDEFVDYYM